MKEAYNPPSAFLGSLDSLPSCSAGTSELRSLSLALFSSSSPPSGLTSAILSQSAQSITWQYHFASSKSSINYFLANESKCLTNPAFNVILQKFYHMQAFQLKWKIPQSSPDFCTFCPVYTHPLQSSFILPSQANDSSLGKYTYHLSAQNLLNSLNSDSHLFGDIQHFLAKITVCFLRNKELLTITTFFNLCMSVAEYMLHWGFSVNAQ